jgi:hypothetical protein
VERRQLDRSQSLVEGLTLFFLLVAVTAGAQPAVTGTLANTTRAESWRYFEPAVEPAGDPNYTFFANRTDIGVHVDGSRFDFGGAFNYVRLENLPAAAIGPGGLGDGAFYFAASGINYSYQLYFSELIARIKSANGTSLTVGRMPFSSGGEGRLRQGSGEPGSELQRVIRDRLESRLIGNFEWSLYQRRFDGARFDVDRSRWHFTAAAFVPTQGGYEESTNLSMPKIQVVDAALTHQQAHAEWQAFGYTYVDRRPEKAVVDNTLSFDRAVDVTIETIGGSYARVTPVASGEIDVVGWIAAQAGDWYGQPHRAASGTIEAGHRWTRPSYHPWLRAGYLWASGDGNAADGRHGTFFQMIPSSRKFATSSVYAQMNLRDAFAQLSVEPRALKVRIEVHALQLASGADLWYSGSGATASSGRYFGFSGRAANGARSLGTVVDGAVEVPVMKYWSISGYGAVMSAGNVVQQQFSSKHLTFWSLENVVRF